MSRFWSEIVNKLTPYVPGEQPALARPVKLNTNENPYPPSPRVVDAIRRELGECHLGKAGNVSVAHPFRGQQSAQKVGGATR